MNKIKQLSRSYFNDSKYTDCYFRIVEKYGNIEYGDGTYCERHHIIPRSIDESLINDKDNIIRVSMRVHVILHKLLTKMCIIPNDYYKMVSAILIMCNEEKMKYFRISSRYVANLRQIAVDNTKESITFEGVFYPQMKLFYESLAPIFGSTPNGIKKYHNKHEFKTYDELWRIIKINKELQTEAAIRNKNRANSIIFEGVKYSSKSEMCRILSIDLNCHPETIARYFRKNKIESLSQLKKLIESGKNHDYNKGKQITFDGILYNKRGDLYEILSHKYNLHKDTIVGYFLESNIETTLILEDIINKKRKNGVGNPKSILFDGVEYSTKSELYCTLANISGYSKSTVQEYIIEKGVKTIDDLLKLRRTKRIG